MNNLSFIVEKDLRGWEDVEEEDISQEELKAYVKTIMPVYTIQLQNSAEELWYPLQEDGGNPWIEYSGRGQPVSDDTLVKVVVVNDRDYKHMEDHSTYRADEIQWFWSEGCKFNVVSYRVVG